MSIGWTSTAGEVSADANDLAGTDVQTQLDDAGARILALESSPGGAADFTATYWVDPNGSAAVDGLSPTKPTTLANAAATVAAGGTIVLAPGVYASPTLTAAGVTLTSMVTQSTPSGAASARLTGTLVLTERNTRIVGIQLGSLNDQSGAAGAGSTVLEQCSLIDNITVSNPAGTQV